MASTLDAELHYPCGWRKRRKASFHGRAHDTDRITLPAV